MKVNNKYQGDHLENGLVMIQNDRKVRLVGGMILDGHN